MSEKLASQEREDNSFLSYVFVHLVYPRIMVQYGLLSILKVRVGKSDGKRGKIAGAYANGNGR